MKNILPSPGIPAGALLFTVMGTTNYFVKPAIVVLLMQIKV